MAPSEKETHEVPEGDGAKKQGGEETFQEEEEQVWRLWVGKALQLMRVRESVCSWTLKRERLAERLEEKAGQLVKQGP